MENELWKPKRFVWLNKTDSEAKTEEVSEEQRRQERAESAFEQFEGKSSKEAQDLIDRSDDWYERRVGEIIENSQGRVWTRLNKLAFDKLGGDKKALNNVVTVAAQTRVRKMSMELGLEKNLRRIHSANSLSVLNAKSELLGDLISNLNADISKDQQRLKELNEARSMLSRIGRKTFVWNTELDTRLRNLRKTRDNANSLKESADAKTGRRAEAFEKIRTHDEKIRSIILRKNPSLAGPLDEAIRESILQKGTSKPLEDFLKKYAAEHSLTTEEQKVCTELIGYLISGSRVSQWTAERFGSFSKSDVQNYYIKKQLDVGILNRDKDSLPNRIARVKSLPLGQQVSIEGQGIFHTVDKSGKGILLRNPDGTTAFLDTSKDGEAFLTVKVDGNRYETIQLKVQKNEKPSLLAIEFSAASEVTKTLKKAKEKRKNPSPPNRINRAIRAARSMAGDVGERTMQYLKSIAGPQVAESN